MADCPPFTNAYSFFMKTGGISYTRVRIQGQERIAYPGASSNGRNRYPTPRSVAMHSAKMPTINSRDTHAPPLQIV